MSLRIYDLPGVLQWYSDLLEDSVPVHTGKVDLDCSITFSTKVSGACEYYRMKLE